MALVSPGIQVTVIDESFYTPAEPGTTPLIVVASAQDKPNGSGTGTATATTQANAGKAFKLTSQRDLVELFGVPFFEKTPSNTPIHGSERNEYGLLAAYSYLGVSSSAFIVRADIDLDQLEGQATAPGAEPDDGTWWVDTNDTTYGIQEWNGAAASTTGGQRFAVKYPMILTSDDSTKVSGNAPRASIGSIGDYAVVFESTYTSLSDLQTKETAKVFYKSAGNGSGNNNATGVAAGEWVLVGSNAWTASHPAVVGTTNITTLTAGKTFIVNGTTVTTASTLGVTVNNMNGLGIAGVTAKVVNNRLYLYTDGATESEDSTKSGNIVIQVSSPVSAGNFEVGTQYTITSVGSTDFTLIGSSDNVIGTTFTANGAGTGSGQATIASAYSAAEMTAIFGVTASTAGTIYYPPALAMTPHTSVPQWKIAGTGQITRPTGSVWIKTTEPGNGARWRTKRWNSATQAWAAVDSPIYDNGSSALYYLDRSGGGVNIPANTVYIQSGATEHVGFDAARDENTDALDGTLATAEFRVFKRATTGRTEITSSRIGVGYTVLSGSESFTIKQSVPGATALAAATGAVTITAGGTDADAFALAAAINALDFGFDTDNNPIPSYVGAEVTDNDELVIFHTAGGEIRFTDGTGTPISNLFSPYNGYVLSGTVNFYSLPAGAVEDYVASNWKPMSVRVSSRDQGFYAQNAQPLNEPVDGQLWYNNDFSDADIMVHDGDAWVGYKNVFANTDPAGPQVAASEPTAQSDGSALVEGDLWISTADLENFPTIYRWNGTDLVWNLVDKTDQITDEGILFADARFGLSGATGNTAASIVDLLTSDYLDPDAPDAALYPRGMLLWNLRRSGGNVKKYNNNYIDQGLDNGRFNNESMADYATDRWTTESGNNEDGSGTFGRKAQRKVVVQRIKSVIDTSEEVRDEERRNFNLIACPGYPEALQNLINLNIDRGQTAFVIGDTPLRLASDATSLLNWGTNASLVTDNSDDGIVSYDEYAAVYYPNGFTTDLGGNNAVVPASHMMLKTFALSDQVSYPWFAPAGTRRGGITNATAVGYIDALSGEFQTVALNEGTRDVLYDLKVNPIPFFVGVGLVAYGQKTRARNASALDRINVARLVVYLRSQLQKLARPYVFEPNDAITRDEIKGAVDSLLLELVGLRALYDFAVVCDESNNTPSRIDRNELYVDIAIEPVKAVEFIYIPLRVKNTGEI